MRLTRRRLPSKENAGLASSLVTDGCLPVRRASLPASGAWRSRQKVRSWPLHLFDDVAFGQHPPDGREPLLPLAWATWLVFGVQQQFPHVGQRPPWALRSRAVCSSTGGSVLRRRRSAQYLARAGSSGDAPPRT